MPVNGEYLNIIQNITDLDIRSVFWLVFNTA